MLGGVRLGYCLIGKEKMVNVFVRYNRIVSIQVKMGWLIKKFVIKGEFCVFIYCYRFELFYCSGKLWVKCGEIKEIM